jgi:hypothetical protein
VKAKLQFTDAAGVVLCEIERPSVGVGEILCYLPHPGSPAIPWPLDEGGNPLPVAVDPRALCLVSS